MSRVSVIALVLVAGAACAVAGCSGGSQSAAARPKGPMSPPPQPRTEAVLVGPLCQGQACRCKQGDGEAGKAAPGEKRYELHLGPSDDPLWATVDGMVLFKSSERAESCYYIDLAPGKHRVDLRGKAEQGSGLSAALSIAEQGGAGGKAWWYRTFDFNCGAPGECTMKDIESWKEQVARLKGKNDPCGSTKIEDLSWETGRMPDRLHPDDLLLHLTLDVYKFTPKNPPGSSACDGGGGAASGAGTGTGMGLDDDDTGEPPAGTGGAGE